MEAEKTIGTKKEVWKGIAIRTSGGLTKKDLMKNKRGKIVSKRQHAHGQKQVKNIVQFSYRKQGSGPKTTAELV